MRLGGAGGALAQVMGLQQGCNLTFGAKLLTGPKAEPLRKFYGLGGLKCSFYLIYDK